MAIALERAGTGFLYGCLVLSAVAWGAHRGWPLAATELLAFLAFGVLVLRACAERRLTWIPLPLARPLLAVVGLAGLQIAIGNRRLTEWALAPSGGPAAPPTPMLLLGSVAPDLTRDAVVLFLAYVSVYVATVHLLRRRRDVERLVWLLVALGALLAFAGLVDYLHGEPLVIRWRDEPISLGRVAGTFVNPDHFASWLAMALFLGIGALLAHHSRAGSDRHGEPGSGSWAWW